MMNEHAYRSYLQRAWYTLYGGCHQEQSQEGDARHARARQSDLEK